MHRSRFAGIIIDCRTEDLDQAAEFWSAALGYPLAGPPAGDDGIYRSLAAPEGETYVEVQKVDHESRVHLDIEADDIDAEAERLEAIGARKIGRVKSWWVMEAPTGQRFCVVPPVHSRFEATANVWDQAQD
ncbi:VOC family protein [Gammaproteobacteria bacterium]|jgi:predicted enzyme related to lactoylglutathione lyase|nr:VOC family protein [Gammaproteobacteria bacterium]